MGFVYFIYSETCNAVKIGYSINPLIRMRKLQTANPDRLRLLLVLRDYKDRETGFHNMWRAKLIRGEWYRMDEEIVRYLSGKKSDFCFRDKCEIDISRKS